MTICPKCNSSINRAPILVGNNEYHFECALKHAQRIKKRKMEDLFQYPNVNGVGVGLRRQGYHRNPQREMCVVVNVRKKVEEHLLNPEEIIPKNVGNIRTDVLETGEIQAPPSPLFPSAKRLLSGLVKNTRLPPRREKKFRPVKGGVSIGHYHITAGTVGFTSLGFSSSLHCLRFCW